MIAYGYIVVHRTTALLIAGREQSLSALSEFRVIRLNFILVLLRHVQYSCFPSHFLRYLLLLWCKDDSFAYIEVSTLSALFFAYPWLFTWLHLKNSDYEVRCRLTILWATLRINCTWAFSSKVVSSVLHLHSYCRACIIQKSVKLWSTLYCIWLPSRREHRIEITPIDRL